MLDRELAALYETETRVLNQSVKRNRKRFPADFMFQLTKGEFEDLRLQIETSEKSMLSQSLMAYLNRRPNTALPLERIVNNNLSVIIQKRAIILLIAR